MEKLFAGDWKKGSVPEMWDGKTASRIVKALLELETLILPAGIRQCPAKNPGASIGQTDKVPCTA
jgi:hypothetical protein